MIELEATARIRAVQFPAGTVAQSDVQVELRSLGVEAKLYDGEFVGGDIGWRQMSIVKPNRWSRWALVGDWVVLLGSGDVVLQAIVLSDDQYRAMFLPKPDRRTLVSAILETLVESATGPDSDTSWASDLEPAALERIGDQLYIGGQYSIDMRQLVDDTLRAARA